MFMNWQRCVSMSSLSLLYVLQFVLFNSVYKVLGKECKQGNKHQVGGIEEARRVSLFPNELTGKLYVATSETLVTTPSSTRYILLVGWANCLSGLGNCGNGETKVTTIISTNDWGIIQTAILVSAAFLVTCTASDVWCTWNREIRNTLEDRRVCLVDCTIVWIKHASGWRTTLESTSTAIAITTVRQITRTTQSIMLSRTVHRKVTTAPRGLNTTIFLRNACSCWSTVVVFTTAASGTTLGSSVRAALIRARAIDRIKERTSF